MNFTASQNEGGSMLQLTDNRAARMLSAGRVTVTFRSPSGQHITILAKARGTNDAGKWIATPLAEAKVIFFEVPNDEGWNDKVGKYTRSRGFVADANADDARAYCAKQLLAYVTGQRTAPGLEIAEEERCGKCGRQLTDPVSIARGIGPECYGASTGSQHETKTRTQQERVTEATTSGMQEQQERVNAATERKAEVHDDLRTAQLSTEEIVAWEYEEEPGRSSWDTERKGDGHDKQGVPLGVGDWRARKEYAKKVASGKGRKVKYTGPEVGPTERHTAEGVRTAAQDAQDGLDIFGAPL